MPDEPRRRLTIADLKPIARIGTLAPPPRVAAPKPTKPPQAAPRPAPARQGEGRHARCAARHGRAADATQASQEYSRAACG
jgi:hypothetical protein